jgi:hypothetical protein
MGVKLPDTMLITKGELDNFTQGVARRLRGGVWHARPQTNEEKAATPLVPLNAGAKVVVSYYNHRSAQGCWDVVVLFAVVEQYCLMPAPPKKKDSEGT